jgi:hypothetical protein
VLIGSGEQERDVRQFLSRYGVKIRKNAVLAYDGILSLSPNAFHTLSPEAYSLESITFLKKEFNGRVRSACIHLDEKTPHIHFSLVPVIKKKDGIIRLCARDYMNRAKMRGMQKRYFEHMSCAFPELKLEPPKYGVKTTHTKVSDFYRELELAKKNLIEASVIEMKEVISERFLESISIVKSEFDELMNNCTADGKNELRAVKERIDSQLYSHNLKSNHDFSKRIKEACDKSQADDAVSKELKNRTSNTAKFRR